MGAVLVSCSTNVKEMELLETIIKLNSAESFEDFESAEKYIDVDRVYGVKEGKGHDSIEVRSRWQNEVSTLNNIGNSSRKFTTDLKYHERSFEYLDISSTKYVVTMRFEPPKKGLGIRYGLEFSKGQWQVVSREYLKDNL